jgi:hypothetical protein
MRKTFNTNLLPQVWDCYFCDKVRAVEWEDHWARCVFCMATLLYDEDETRESL